MSCCVFLQTYLTVASLCDGEGDIPVSGHLPALLVTSVVPFFAVLNGLLARGLLLPPGQYALDMSGHFLLQTYLTVAIFCYGEGDIPDCPLWPICLATPFEDFFAAHGWPLATRLRPAPDENAL